MLLALSSNRSRAVFRTDVVGFVREDPAVDHDDNMIPSKYQVCPIPGRYILQHTRHVYIKDTSP